jgi:hypothetical protein
MFNKRGGRGGYTNNPSGNNYRGGRGGRGGRGRSNNYNNYNNTQYSHQSGGHHYSNKHNYNNNYYYNNNDNYGYNNYSQSHQQYQQPSNYYYGNQQQYQQQQFGYDYNNQYQPQQSQQYQNYYAADQQPQQQQWIDPAFYLQVYNNPEYASFSPMDRIPDVLIVKILSYLQDYKAIVKLSEVSRRWMYVTEEGDLWMSLATNHAAYKTGKYKKTEDALPWKIFFMEMLEDEKDAARHQVDLAMTAQMMNELNIVEGDDDEDIDRYIEEFERHQQANPDTDPEDESGEGYSN